MFDLRRREFVTLLGGVAATWALAARAQQPKMLRVGYSGILPREAPHYAAFEKRMAELGYQQGRNFTFEYIQAPSIEGYEPIYRELADEAGISGCQWAIGNLLYLGRGRQQRDVAFEDALEQRRVLSLDQGDGGGDVRDIRPDRDRGLGQARHLLAEVESGAGDGPQGRGALAVSEVSARGPPRR